MEIKRIGPSESDLVAELFNKYRIFYRQGSNIELAKSFIQTRLDNNESVIFVALMTQQSDSIPAGFTQLYPKYSSARATKNWILNDLYVDDAFREQGIGEKLIKTAIIFARDQGADFVQLSTAIDNYTAQKLYEHIGFEKQNPNTGFLDYRINLEGL